LAGVRVLELGSLIAGPFSGRVLADFGAEVVKIMAAPDIEERARNQGFRVDARGPVAFAAFVKDEVDRWARVIVAAKISIE